ncbi:unnamed protein product, partial [Tetraodon nigroviridis]
AAGRKRAVDHPQRSLQRPVPPESAVSVHTHTHTHHTHTHTHTHAGGGG